MSSFQINDEEREALRGLPMLAREIYVFGLRPFMDFSTGIVGERRGISWKSIAEELYVEPHQGIKGGEPTEKELRRALVWLQKAGLVGSNQAERRLIFELPIASRDQSARKKVGSKWADQAGSYPGSAEPSNHAGLPEEEGGEAGGCKTQKVGTPPESGNPPTSLLRTHDAAAPRTVFPMHDGWAPSETGWRATLIRNGLGKIQLSEDSLMEFRSYWINRPDKHQTQGQWEHDLAQSIKRENRHAQANGKASPRTGRQRPLSAVDRVKQSIAERHAAEAAQAAAGAPLGSDDRDLRPPLDGEFRRVT